MGLITQYQIQCSIIHEEKYLLPFPVDILWFMFICILYTNTVLNIPIILTLLQVFFTYKQ